VHGPEDGTSRPIDPLPPGRAAATPPEAPTEEDADPPSAEGSGFVSPPSAARDLAVDLVKLFITFATAGIAFLVGAVFSGKIMLSASTIIACLVLFVASAICGIAFIMQAVSGVHEGRYNVTAPSPTWISFIQMVLFGIGAMLLGWQAIKRAGAPIGQPATTQIEIRASARRWTIDTAGGIALHKDRGARDGGTASLRIRATSDGLTLRIELDTSSARATAAPPRP
jgi:hypothetical protein